MDDTTNVGGRDRLVRFLLAAGLSIAAVRWLRSGKRIRGLLAGVGALGFGFNATTGYCGANDALDIDTTTDTDADVDISPNDTETDVDHSVTTAGAGDTHETESAGLHCDVCGEAIVPGQRRGPTEDGEIAHADCQ